MNILRKYKHHPILLFVFVFINGTHLVLLAACEQWEPTLLKGTSFPVKTKQKKPGR